MAQMEEIPRLFQVWLVHRTFQNWEEESAIYITDPDCNQIDHDILDVADCPALTHRVPAYLSAGIITADVVKMSVNAELSKLYHNSL